MIDGALPLHGLRASYLAGCRCTPCRAANARYEEARRKAHAAGRPPLGSRIPAARTHILIRVIRTEAADGRWSNRKLGLHLFGSYRQFKRVRAESTVTLRTHKKVLRFYHLHVAEPEQMAIPIDHAQG